MFDLPVAIVHIISFWIYTLVHNPIESVFWILIVLAGTRVFNKIQTSRT